MHTTSKYLSSIIYSILGVFVLQLIGKTFIPNVYDFLLLNFGLSTRGFYSFWQFITYAFLHDNFIHLIANLIILYFVGELFLRYFTEKQLLYYFILGAVVGGLFYFFGYDLLVESSVKTPILLGASASINTLLVALTVKKPSLTVHLRLIGEIKLWFFTFIVLFLNLIAIQGANIGGVLAHFGGALTGLIVVLFSNRLNFNVSLKKKSPLKVVYKEESFGQTNYQKQRIKQSKIDGLLEKIGKSGYESLTTDEKDFLKEASKE